MKGRTLFIAVAAAQLAILLVCIARTVYLFYFSIQYNDSFELWFPLIFTVCLLLLSVFPGFCIYLARVKYPDGHLGRSQNRFYRAGMVFYFISSFLMICVSAFVIGSFFMDNDSNRPSYPPVYFKIIFLLFTIGMLYLMSAAIKLRALIKKNYEVAQFDLAARLGENITANEITK